MQAQYDTVLREKKVPTKTDMARCLKTLLSGGTNGALPAAISSAIGISKWVPWRNRIAEATPRPAMSEVADWHWSGMPSGLKSTFDCEAFR